jgi:hypothetical protein
MSVSSLSPAVPGPRRWERGPVSRPEPVPRGQQHGRGTAAWAGAPAPAPYAPVTGGGQVSWIAAHGGAGVTSLAAALGGADLGTRWPDPARGEPGRILVVARTHAAGIQAASTVLGALRDGSHPSGLELLGIVLVADAPGRLPLALARRIRVLSSAVATYQVPWIPSWRLGARTADLPKKVAALAELTGHRPAGMRGPA